MKARRIVWICSTLTIFGCLCSARRCEVRFPFSCFERRAIFTCISWRKIFDADHEVFKILLLKVEKKKHSLFESKTKGIFLSFTCLQEQHITLISERCRQFCFFFTKRSTLLLEKSRKINFLHLFFIEQHAKFLPFLLMLVDQVKS